MVEKTQKYRIIETRGNRFFVLDGGDRLCCYSRNRNKKDEILCGDFVFLSRSSANGGEQELVIESIEKRKNRLVRPAIANIDQIVFVVCALPKPDFYMLDKAIVNCLQCGVDVVICINKVDLDSAELCQEISQQYGFYPIITLSAISGQGMDTLTAILDGKLTCLAGQSAVGKSTLVSALTGETVRVGTLSNVGRGKNTTTATQLYQVADGLLADTPGFNMLDVFGIEYDKLELYYPEFERVRDGCKYRGCTHTTEPFCAVRQAVSQGEINQKRYDRYQELFSQLKQNYLKKF